MGIRRKYFEKDYDVVVVGGGLTGVCAAIASARGGAATALIQDRPVLGGNASSEIRMHICGASANNTKPDSEETGILHEILLENKACNDYHNFSVWDNVLFQKVKGQKNLDLYLNTSMQDVTVEGNTVRDISCYQMTTEKHIRFSGRVFIDCTGNGTLCYFAGSDYRSGCEGRSEFQEPDAPEQANGYRMGNTLLFKAVNRGVPVTYKTPEWVRKFTEEDLKYRNHGDYTPEPRANDIEDRGYSASEGNFAAFGIDYGYWWIELPGTSEDYVSDYEDIRDELVRCVYGVWDHLKNEGDHGAEDFDLQWVGMLPGVREGRRISGNYILTENDLLNNRVFEDAVAYGGWPVDNHAPRGLDDKDVEASFIRHFPGLYTIPYRCYCNQQLVNVMQAGRIISATKLAMSSTRVMGTCAVGGQAVGTAAAMCVRTHNTPAQLGASVRQLQQRLLLDDCYIPGVAYENPRDLSRFASVQATSQLSRAPAENVINGHARNWNGAVNFWESDGISPNGERITLDLKTCGRVSQLRLVFDSNLNVPTKITLSAKRIGEQRTGVPPELVKDYRVELYRNGTLAARYVVRGNYQRLNILDIPDGPVCDTVCVVVEKTNGHPNARIFEIRVLESAE